jgi:hypothetical protein
MATTYVFFGKYSQTEPEPWVFEPIASLPLSLDVWMYLACVAQIKEEEHH